jgi:hypothetical protein
MGEDNVETIGCKRRDEAKLQNVECSDGIVVV